MLLEYEIANFKAFAGPERIPIRPITLLFGPNSSGKSSILQSLLLLKQTVEEAEDPEIPILPRGKLTDVGNYREFVHRHEVESDASFKLTVQPDRRDARSTPWGRLIPNLPGSDETGLRFVFSYDTERSITTLSAVEYFGGDRYIPALRLTPVSATTEKPRSRSAVRLSLQQRRAARGLLTASKPDFRHNFWVGFSESYINQVNKSLPEIRRVLSGALKPSDEDRDELLARRQREFRILLDHMPEGRAKALARWADRWEADPHAVIQDLFSETLQTSYWSYRNFLPVDVDREENRTRSRDNWYEERLLGEIIDAYGPYGPIAPVSLPIMAANTVRRHLESIVYLGPLRDYPERLYVFTGNPPNKVGKTGAMLPDILFKDKALLRQINEYLNRFALGYTISIDESPSFPDVFQLRLVDKANSLSVSITDAGFGVSQVLPVLVQSMLAIDTTLCIEQPEIHLHPTLQSELGSLFATCIKEPFCNRFIIETHSEHIMLRLQKLVRTRVLKSDDVSVVYVDRLADGAKCLPLRLDDDGRFIDRWPGGFFEEGYREIFD